MKPYSILLLGTQMAIGGAQRVLLDQAKWLHERGHRVTVAFFYDKEGIYPKWHKDSNFPVVNLRAYRPGAGRIENALLLLQGLWSLWKLMRNNRFDVLESFTPDSNLLGIPLAWMVGIPARVATSHGELEGVPRWRENLHAWLVNHKIASVLVAVSDTTRQNAIRQGIHPGRIFVIQNGISPVSFEGVDRAGTRLQLGVGEQDTFLLSVGRLVYQKGHEFLVAAMPAILKEYPNTKAGICGDGVLRPQLEAQIKALDLEKSVLLLGRSDNVPKFLAAADVFVLPSRSEGLPIALLEAMSRGLPVVATLVEGVDEVVADGEHGLRVPIGDSAAMSNAILRLLRNPQMSCRLGSAAKKRVLESYSLDRMVERYLSLMESILAKSQSFQ